MRKHFLLLLLLGACCGLWKMAQPKPFRLLVGDRAVVVSADEVGLRQLAGLVEHERLAGDLCLENLLHLDDAGPYRRKSLLDGKVKTAPEHDVRWVYDPANPHAQEEGQYKGYVALPNIDLDRELMDLAAHQHLEREYLQAWRRLQAACSPRLAVVDPVPQRRSGLLLQCRQYFERAQQTHRHNLENQERPGYRCQGLTVDHPYLRLAQGALKSSPGPFHVALDDNGKGFFVLSSATGEKYTRNGRFHRATSGLLTSWRGDPVLGTAGPIRVSETGKWIDDQGWLAGGASLRVVRPLDPQAMHETQDGSFVGSMESTTDFRLKVGYLEQANFDPRAEERALQRATLLLGIVRGIPLTP